MKRIRHVAGQGDLFATSRIQELRERIRELDGLITRALKSKDYAKAKAFTRDQETLIQELVEMGEKKAVVD